MLSEEVYSTHGKVGGGLFGQPSRNPRGGRAPIFPRSGAIIVCYKFPSRFRRNPPILPELRKDPITGRWVIIATDRAKRPTRFHSPAGGAGRRRLCPFDAATSTRRRPRCWPTATAAARDEPGWRVRVVPNKFPVLGIEGELNRQGEGHVRQDERHRRARGHHRDPGPRGHPGELPEKQIEDVLWAFRTASTI